MGKFLKYLTLLIVILFALTFFIWNMLPSWVSSNLSKKAGVTVTIGEIKADFDSIKIDNLSVGNPPGFVLSKALMVKESNIQVPMTHFLEDQIIIPQMNLRNIYVGIEFTTRGGPKGNWTTIMNNLKNSSSAHEDAQKSVLIKRLVLDNLDIELAYTDEKGKTTKLKAIDHLEFTDVSSTGGIPSAQIMNLVLQQALQKIFSIENIQNMIDNALTPENVSKTIQGLFSHNDH